MSARAVHFLVASVLKFDIEVNVNATASLVLCSDAVVLCYVLVLHSLEHIMFAFFWVEIFVTLLEDGLVELTCIPNIIHHSHLPPLTYSIFISLEVSILLTSVFAISKVTKNDLFKIPTLVKFRSTYYILR